MYITYIIYVFNLYVVFVNLSDGKVGITDKEWLWKVTKWSELNVFL